MVVMPVLVSRKSQRRFSTARMRDILSVCQGAQVSPYQPSLEMLTSTWAPRFANSRISSPNISS